MERNVKAFKMVGIAVLVVFAIYMKFSAKDNDSEDIKTVCTQAVQALPTYDEDKEFILKSLDAHFEVSFNQAYKLGGRRRSSEFDSDKFIVNLFSEMSIAAENSGKKQLAFDLLKLKGKLRDAITEG